MCNKKSVLFTVANVCDIYLTSIVGVFVRTSDYFDTSFQLLSSCKMKVYCTLLQLTVLNCNQIAPFRLYFFVRKILCTLFVFDNKQPNDFKLEFSYVICRKI